MRQLPTALITQNIELQREPRAAIKIFNDQGAFWFLSHDDITPGDGLDTFGGLVATGATSQKIDPEKGWSTIGGMSIRMQDRGGLLTDRLRAIDVAGDSLNQNKAEVWFGFRDLDFSDYGKLYTFIVDGIESDEIEYSFKLSDRQRLEKRQIFTPRNTKLFAVVQGSELNDLTVETVLNGSGVIELLDASVLSLVEHDDDWDTDPGETIGYFAMKGVDSAGNDIEEVFSFTGFDGSNPNRVTGVTRSRFGTGAIEAKGTVNDGSTEVSEYVYLDLPVPKMIIALLTGDLYGQPGATIPDHWSALLTASDIDLASFENIGDDLWALPFGFQGAEKDEAKGFIGRELLRACDLFLKVNQDGELELKRFSSVPQNAAPAHVFDESEILSITNLVRDAKHIRNRFLINWEYRSDIDRFVRNNFFVDQTSIDKYNVISDILSLDFKGLRNRSRDIQNSIQSLAEGIRARYSAPAVEPTIRVPMAYGLEIEVGDVVAVDLSQWPDYADTAGLASSFEVQSVGVDLISQTMTLGLFGTSGEPTPINFGEGNDVVDIDHTGWKELSASLTSAGISYTEAGGTLTITGNGTLSGGPTTAPEFRYYYDGNVTVADGVTLVVTNNFVLDAADIDLSGAIIDGKGRGLPGGNGALVTGVSATLSSNYTLGQSGYIGGNDLSEEGVRVTFDFRSELFRFPKNNGSVPASRSQIESIGLRVDSGNIIGFESSSFLGSSGSGGMYSILDDGAGTAVLASSGGDGGDGGASISFFCENLFTNSSTKIITSGGDSERPQPVGALPHVTRAGSGGPGWPGCLLIFLKSNTSPLPALIGRHVSTIGEVTDLQTYQFYPLKSNLPVRVPAFAGYDSAGPLRNGTSEAYKDVDLSGATRLVKYITSDVAATPTPGVDKIGPADLPTIALAEQINTPQTPKGNVSTVTITATPPTDDRYSYSIFEYRALGQDAWYPLEYKIANETTKELPTDGSVYEFSARSVSTAGQVSTSRVIAQITLSVVSEDPEETNTDVDAIQVAQIRRLELVNAISDDEDTQWKGPDAEFRWAKLRFGETNVESDPKQDMHLDGYRVQVFRTSDGKLLRELTVQDTFYVYTLADNRRDNTDSQGNPTPVRSIRVKVAAVAATGKTSKAASITVENPAPAPVTGVEVIYTLEGIELSYTPPGDVDFRGVKVRGRLYTGTSITLEPMTARSETLEIVSVDQFGDGEALNYGLVNAAPAAVTDVETEVGFTNIDVKFVRPTDYDYIGVNVRYRVTDGAWNAKKLVRSNAFSIDGRVVGTEYEIELTSVDTIGEGSSVNLFRTTRNIDSSELPDTIEKSITLDEVDGRLITNNSGFIGVWGITTRLELSPNPLIMHDWDSVAEESTFWFDVAGNYSLGRGGYTYDIATSTHTFGDFATGKYMLFDGTDLVFGPNTSIGNNNDRAVTVGPTGDYATINEALEDLSKVYASYKNGGFTATITLQSGFIINESIIVVGVDLSWITINSVDAIVEATADGLVIAERRGLFYADNGKTPIIDISLELTTAAVTSFNAIFKGINGGLVQIAGAQTVEYTSAFVGGILFETDSYGKVLADEIEVTGGSSTAIFSNNDSNVRLNNLTMNGWDSNFTIIAIGSGSKLVIEDTLETNDVQTTVTEPSVAGLLYTVSGGDISIGTLLMNSPSGNVVNRIASGGAGGKLYIGQGSARHWSSFGIRGARSNFVINGNFRKNGAGDSSDDIVVGFGAIIQATGSLGGTNQAVNTITADGLIIK